MKNYSIVKSRRLRSTPYTSRIEKQGVTAYTVYNHMLLPAAFGSIEESCDHLKKDVQIWDVAAERQVEISGTDSAKLVQLMTCRDLSKSKIGRCYYCPIIDDNGNLVNASDLKEELENSNRRHINSTSDSEILLNIFADCLMIECSNASNLNETHIFNAVNRLHQRVEGAYAVVILILGYGIVAFRDPNGIRPLIYGHKNHSTFMVASESVALDCLGFDTIDDVQPGECVVFNDSKNGYVKSSYEDSELSPCIFEYVYLARPDSTIDKVNVYQSRLEMGRNLAFKIKKTLNKDELDSIDVVIPIPDTSRNSALPISTILDKDLREGFVKNRYIGRTFIMPGQKVRKKSVKQKLNTIDIEFKDKNVLLIDDSIVRGNTSKQIVEMARDAGAKKIYFASASPKISFPNVYGIDMPYVDELIAFNKSTDEICDLIGADRLIYQNIDDLVKSVQTLNPSIKKFDTSCFTGKYITNVSDRYLNNLKAIRKGEDN